MVNEWTNFGFEKILKTDKVKKVMDVFNGVSNVYDLMNDVMSLGIHRLWKKEFVKKFEYKDNMQIIDVGGGTGDITNLVLDNSFEKKFYNNVVTMFDINMEMLKIGKEKLLKNGIMGNANVLLGNAEQLPFKDNSFDVYLIAFCIRNVTDIHKVLEEAYRVLKPNGVFLCLEFSEIEGIILKKFYDVWSFNVLPLMGKLIAKNQDAYKYLAESIRKFPKQEEFLHIISNAKFKDVYYKNLSNGVVAIHGGIK